jgi:hypothetical protein
MSRFTGLLMVFALLSLPGLAQEAPAFLQMKTKTFDKEKFVFPDDFAAPKLNIVFLSISDNEDSGRYQQQVLLSWHAALDEQAVFNEATLAYHFSVIKNPPFFVKGFIRNGISKNYEGQVPFSQAGIIYSKDLSAFTAAAGLELDGQATIVLVTADGQLHEVFKGEVSPEGIAAIRSAQATYVGEDVVQPEEALDNSD